MEARRYHIIHPDGAHSEPLDEDAVCLLIEAGAVALDALIAPTGATNFVPITQYTIFARAFESRLGIGGPAPRGSDSTPVSQPLKQAELLARLRGDSTTLSAALVVPTHDLDSEETAARTLVTEADDATPVSIAPVLDDVPATHPSLEPLDPSEEGDRTLPTQEGLDDTRDSVPGLVETVPSAQVDATEPEAVVVPAMPDVDPGPRPEPMLQLALGLCAWAVLFALLYGASVVLGFGEAESRREPSSPLLHLRNALFVLSGLLLIPRFLPIRTRELTLPWSWLGLAVVVGVPAGLLLPSTPSAVAIPAAALFGSLQAGAEEIFFRGYLGRTLAISFRNPLAPIALNGVAFGLYAATYAALWESAAVTATLAGLLGATLAGTLFAAVHFYGRSLVPAAVAHVVAAITAAIVA